MTGALVKPTRSVALAALAGLSFTVAGPVCAQQSSAVTGARAQAPYDLTGYWVSIVTQDWIYRMTVPQRGVYQGIPINAKAQEFADAWTAAPDEAAGKQCEAYGAAAIMQVPTRLRIDWPDDETLRVQTDTGMQTRLLKFATPAPTPASWQGASRASWQLPEAAGGAAAGAQTRSRFGWLRVETGNLLPGLLRLNGVPYSGQSHLTENWIVNVEPDGDRWLTVTSVLTDPVYLQLPYAFTSVFRKEPDGSRWHPTPCSLSW